MNIIGDSMTNIVTTDNVLGKKLRKERLARQLTQTQLAKKFNVEKQTVSNWENGYRKPDLVTVSKLATFFDVSIDYLVDHDFVSENEIPLELKRNDNIIIEEIGEGIELHFRNTTKITSSKLKIIKAVLAAMDDDK